MVKHKKDKKDKKDKKVCGCRKRGKKCINPNPCTECKKANKKEEEIEKDKVKRPRGRPRKIDMDNKDNKVSTECKVKGKRGRPKKVYALSAYAESQLVPLVPTRTYKAYGFCPKCKLSIAEIDVDVKDGKFKCPKCDTHGMLGELTKELGIEKAKTKKEYLQSVNSVYTWHDYNGSSNINTIKRTDLVEDDDHEEPVKSDEEMIINKMKGKKVE